MPTKTPVQSTVAQLIVKNQRSIESVLPKHLDAKRMSRIALVQARQNPGLLRADPLSFIGALIQASQLGLEPGVAGMGALVTFGNEVAFIPGYRGLMDLARRSGQVGSITADVVREGDTFVYHKGTNPDIQHVPVATRGEITHVYAVAHLLCNDWQFEVMSKADVDEVKAKARGSKSGPWVDHYAEMAKKTAIRRLCKYLPVSVEVQRAVSLDEMHDANISQNNAAMLPEDFIGDLADDMEIPAG